MPFDPFRVDLDGVLGLSRAHADAAETLTGARESALAKAAGADATHGSIGTRVTGAFSEVLDARHGALQTAAHTSGELSQRLAKAVLAYSRADESGAESVRAAAEAMTGGSYVSSGVVGAAESTGITDVLGQARPDEGHIARPADQPTGGVGAAAGPLDESPLLMRPGQPEVDAEAEHLSTE
jgi:hypothetical protein